MMNDFDDGEWVRAVQRGDVRAFEPLVEAHLDAVRAFIGLKLPVAHLTNELAHETFVFAFRNIDRFKAGTSFRGWLRAIAANLIRAELQRFRREQTNQLGYARHRLLEATVEHPPADAPVEVEHLLRCIEALPANLGQLLEMKYRQELSIDEMAGRLARTPNAVWQALFRLRQQLRQCMEARSGKARS